MSKPSIPPATTHLLLVGAAFGYAMNKGQVYLPVVIMNQMTFERFTMMKMFAGALGMSLVSKSIFRAVEPAEFERMQACRASSPSAAPVLVAGGLILGAGMAICGSCPGSVYVQLGAQLPSALPCLAGTAVGTAVASALRPRVAAWQELRSKVASTLPLGPASQALLGMGCMAIAAGLEFALPEPVAASTWYPSLAGIAVGCLQLPMVFLLRKSLGASAGMKILLGEAASALEGTIGKTTWLPRFTDISQAIFVLGVVAGSCAASYYSLEAAHPCPTALRSVVGGALIAFGASIAGGCTSGHGLSGSAMLMASSWIVLPSIFIGGIATAAIQRTLQL
ncbi:hypothetical protein ACHHYP_06392 [Achlya hypogyna]|uniref:Uncharacterized protein n=1 Tax=Achlya hypogyna TaxID=1202772 RepID=A0A1V9YTX4_ACHHY|nr:hypothetical protein ACHHYP_06392 [Achlya hypogyna]